MTVVAVVGSLWGDEGKGRQTAIYAMNADIGARGSGSHNAGHKFTISDKTYNFHIVPSTLVYNRPSIIGNGVVLNPPVFFDEVDSLQNQGLNAGNIYVSNRTGLIMPYHLFLEALQELTANDYRIDTTMRGVGPAYEDKTERHYAIRVEDLFDKDNIARKFGFVFPIKAELIRTYQEIVKKMLEEGKIKFIDDPEQERREREKYIPFVENDFVYDLDSAVDTYYEHGRTFRNMVCDTAEILYGSIKKGENILLEGAQGTMLDVDHASDLPYSTSCATTVNGICQGLGIPASAVDERIGIVKAYANRVGNGLMPNELVNDGNEIRNSGREYGSTTGRPRRIGWLSDELLRRSHMLNAYTGIDIVGLNVLAGSPDVKFYADGKLVDMKTWDSLKPSEISSYEDLPEGARYYVNAIRRAMDRVPVNTIALGFDISETLVLRNPFDKN